MKNKWIIVFFIFSLFCFVSIGLYAQDSTIEPKLIGTWVELNNSIWVFNSNGTGTITNGINTISFKYLAFSNKAVIYRDGGYGDAHAFDLVFNSNANTVMLLPIGGFTYSMALNKRS